MGCPLGNVPNNRILTQGLRSWTVFIPPFAASSQSWSSLSLAHKCRVSPFLLNPFTGWRKTSSDYFKQRQTAPALSLCLLLCKKDSHFLSLSAGKSASPLVLHRKFSFSIDSPPAPKHDEGPRQTICFCRGGGEPEGRSNRVIQYPASVAQRKQEPKKAHSKRMTSKRWCFSWDGITSLSTTYYCGYVYALSHSCPGHWTYLSCQTVSQN